MRHFKTDVSHRIKRRPSIFTAVWFRAILGLGLLVILGLLFGPTVLGWLRGDARSTIAARPGPRPRPAPAPARPAPRVEPSGATAPATSTSTPESPRAAATPGAANGAAKATEAPPAPLATTPPARPAPAASKPEPSPAPGAGSVVYRIQVGAFLDHRNADRLIERLGSEGAEVVNSIVEESRTLYRVLATPPDGEAYPALAQRLQSLGFMPEPADNGLAVTRPLPLRPAVDLSRRLREQGIPVRLDRQASSAAFRVVRVGAYATTEEAERARAELATRGYEGIVVRESR